MTPLRTSRQHGVPLLLATLVVGCQDSVGLSRADVAGSYDLRSVSGSFGMAETPVDGMITLTPDGVAQRQVTYQTDTSGTVREVVALGTYRLAGSILHLALRENGAQGADVWSVQAELEPGGGLRLAYPRPADGTIVESYQRRWTSPWAPPNQCLQRHRTLHRFA